MAKQPSREMPLRNTTLGRAITMVQGAGVPKDYVTAYTWSIIAVANGSEVAEKNKPNFLKKLTPVQITQFQARVINMAGKFPKLIK